MGIPLQQWRHAFPWGDPSIPKVVLHNLCVFYHKGLSTCNSTAWLSLVAQFSH